MSRVASGKILKVTVKRKQKNGDIYVYERETRYDPKKGYNVTLNSKLLYKIPFGSDTPVPTRPKKLSKKQLEKQQVQQSTTKKNTNIFNARQEEIDATCERTGLTSILHHVGNVSGIDKAVTHSMQESDALKAISVARYIVATDGAPLPQIEEWQLRHVLPYTQGITEQNYHDLFKSLGVNEIARQKLFAYIGKDICSDSIIFDSTTISTYSENIDDARFGFNKDNDGLPTIKILTFYSRAKKSPIAFSMQPGDISDKVCVPNALKELDFLDIERYLLVTDTGFCTDKALTIYFKNNKKFLTLISKNRSWIKPLVEKALPKLTEISSVNKVDYNIQQWSTSVFHDFTWQRKYNGNDKTKGDTETLKRRVYVHIFRSETRARNESDAFKIKLLSLAKRVEENQELSTEEEKQRDKFLRVTKKRGITQVSFNEEAYKEALKFKGIFVLISNSIKDPNTALKYYRQREWIEEYFKKLKNNTNASKPRVWNYDTFKGKMTVQFIAMVYYSWLYNAINEMKSTLGKPNGDPKHDLKQVLDAENALKSWLNNKSLQQILMRFDSLETVKAKRKNQSISWTTEITARDKLFLQKLGMKF